jgi:branched-chain amino acid transport system permease protein
VTAYALSVLAYLGINVLLAYSLYLPLATHQFSLGTAGFMAIGAYVASDLTVVAKLPLAVGILGGFLTSACAGVLVGFPALRLRGLYLAMATFAFGEMVRTFFLNFEPTGGALGFRGMVLAPEWAIWLSVLIATTSLVGLSKSRFGLAMRAIRDDDLVAELVGLNTVAIRVSVFGFGAGLAGLAGGLYAHYALYIEPGQFSFLRSIEAALTVILGGSFTVFGPLLGASIFTLLPELLRELSTWRGAAFGLLILGLLLVRPTGLVPRGFLERRRSGALAPDPGLGAQESQNAPAVSPAEPRWQWTKDDGSPLLEVRGLSRSFGGVQAICSVDLAINAGEILGVIGPNGAGKTTLFNLLTGVVSPSSGSIELAGESVVGLTPRDIVGRGVARTFQNLRLFHSLTVLENVLVAQSGRSPAVGWLLPSLKHGGHSGPGVAWELLDQFHLAKQWDCPAAALSYGQQRRLEIARALATGPRLLLVDEPAAGMNAVESAELMSDLRQVRERGVTIMLIEHDMSVIMGLCDRIAVLDFGEMIAEGTPAEIQRDPRVLEAYVGQWDEAG